MTGHRRIWLAPLRASARGRELTATGWTSVARDADVLVGDVWLCADQSNMKWVLARLDGGTQIQCWMPAANLAAGPWPQDNSTDLALFVAALRPPWKRYLAAQASARTAVKPSPAPPAGWPNALRGPSVFWNGMVTPLLPLRVRCIVWYQGENNAYVGVADTYGALLRAIIAAWRAGFRRLDLPFVVIQISGYRQPQTDPNEVSGMAQLQEAQLQAVQLTPNTTLVLTLDLGAPNVHYTDNEPAADHTLQSALALAYGRRLDASGPILRSLTISGDHALVRFTHAAGGLVVRGGSLTGFTIAGMTVSSYLPTRGSMVIRLSSPATWFPDRSPSATGGRTSRR